MIPFHTVFLIMVLIFALIGSLRGWAKELIVAFSVLLALFLEQVLTSLVPPIAALWGAIPLMSKFWIRVVVFAVIVVFGYASPSLASRFGAKIARERLQDALLGFFIGVLNGLLIIGTIWFFLDDARYGVPQAQWSDQLVWDEVGQPVFDESGQQMTVLGYLPDAEGLGGIHPPATGSPAANLLPYLPPRIITGPPLYLGVGLAFVFVLIVFI